MLRRFRAPVRGRAAAALLAAVVVALLATGLLALVSSVPARSTTPPSTVPPPAASTTPVPSAARPAASSVVGLSAVFDDGSRAVGSGIVLTSTGEVLTCDHLVDQARWVTAWSYATGRSYPATLVGVDRTADAAVIQLHDSPAHPTASGLTPVRRGDPADLLAGDAVTAVSSRGNGAPTVTPGAVTALGRGITLTDSAGGTHRLEGLIEFRAALRHGDSGGALVNEGGEVVGMVVAASRDPDDPLVAAVPLDRATATAGGRAGAEVTSPGGRR
ncbi:S1C family serine protease [Actinomycetospora cinnamomea]|uniref:Trypsin-like peptidase n=1 Tax=Actinomycetospora cinnamomea TaxID=663609 RepID=A0A2U1E9V3_9PSEU|nr:trypsin-like peptidase domain-containing protein [Actinomycetospora cinnamomea]PVY96728.1 trypsin-like peptidase [Actinomycetospora cinnamomea]